MVGTSEESFFTLSKLETKSPHTKFSGRERVDVNDFVQSRAEEEDDAVVLNPKSNLALAIDPLDGSSDIECFDWNYFCDL